jgi:hypothetical protein
MKLAPDKKSNFLEVDRIFNPHREAMLAALRLVLSLPQVPVILEGKESSNQC